MANQVSPWGPFKDMMTLRQAMDQLFEDSFVRSPGSQVRRGGERMYQLPVDAYTTEEAVVLKASLPGVDPESVDITFEGDTVTIRGELKGDEGQNFVIRERPTGVFTRSVTLNVPVNADQISAEFNQGVLTLTLPKSEAVKPRKIAIKTQ